MKENHIQVAPDASIIDISEAAYKELKNLRVSNELLVTKFDELYGKSNDLVLRASELEPRIVEQCEEYLKVYQEDMLQKELKKLKINNWGVMRQDLHLNEITDRFIETCDKAGVEVMDFVNAYRNLKQLPLMTEELKIYEDFFTTLVGDFAAYKGEYLALQEIIETQGNSQKLFELTERYYKEEKALNEAYSLALDKEDFSYQENLNNPIEENYIKMRSASVKADEAYFKYTESAAKKEAIDNFFLNKPITNFTQKGGLFIGLIAVLFLADELLVSSNIRGKVANRNNIEGVLLDTLADNEDNLFPTIESLPQDIRKSAFAYIAENHYDAFIKQAGNLLFTLKILGTQKETTADIKTNINSKVNQEFEQYLDKNYKIVEEQIGSYGL